MSFEVIHVRALRVFALKRLVFNCVSVKIRPDGVRFVIEVKSSPVSHWHSTLLRLVSHIGLAGML